MTLKRILLAASSALSLVASGPAFAQSIGQTGSISLGANQSVNLTQVNGSAIALGQTTMSASLPVTIASNQAAYPIFSAPTSASANGIAPVQTSAVATGLVVKASAGNLYDFEVTSGATAGEVLIHNTTTVPAAGAVTPVKCYILPANSTIGGSWTPPISFGTGISVSFSSASTCFTQTNSATAFISADAS